MAIETKKSAPAPAVPAEEPTVEPDALYKLNSTTETAVPSSWLGHDLDGWDEFVDRHPYGHLLQLRAWRALKCRFGWTSSRIVVPQADRSAPPLGGAEILYRRALGLLLAYVPRGPVVDWEQPEAVGTVLRTVEETARAQGAAVLKLEPPVLDSLHTREVLAAHGYTPSPQTVQPPSTIRVSLAEDEDAILARMKSKWRYNIRLAQRKEVTVRPATAADLPVFNELMTVTGARDGFAVHSAAYYAAAFELLTPDHGVFLLAEYEGQPLAGVVVAHCGDTAVYLWGASNNRERNRMPNHALQWAGMQWAKARGAAWYDLWGVPDAIGLLALGLNRGVSSRWPAEELPVEMENLPDHDLWGVYRFKQGFGGEAVRYVGTWDKPLHPVGARVYRVGIAARDVLLRAKAAPDLPSAAGEVVDAVLELAERAADRRLPVEPVHAPASENVPMVLSESLAADKPLTNGVEPVTDARQWQATLAHFAAPHVLQSWEWGELKAQTGWEAHRFRWQGRAGEQGAFQLLRRRFVPGLPWSIGYVPKGPVADWDKLADPAALLAAIEAQARALGCIFVKIDPDVRADLPVGQQLTATLQTRGWRFSPNQIQFQNTAFTHLPQDVEETRGDTDDVHTAAEESLLADMKSKWRYNIRLAERRGIQVREGSVVDLPLFYGLYAQTGARDGFLVRPYGYYLETWRTFLQAQQDADNPAGGALLLAEHPDELEPVAGIFLLCYGPRAWYFYGASSERRRRDMPNHLLQWAALRWSLAQGCTVYDWWGAPIDPDDPDDGLQGVWQFKQGFNAELQPHIGAWDFAVHPRAYAMFMDTLPRVLNMMRRLRG